MSSIALRSPQIAFISGSIRSGSFNTQLVVSAERIASALGAKTDIIDLSSFELPLYNQDLEAEKGLPPAAVDLKARLGKQDAWVVASPEYNGFPTPLLVNTFTWLSRGDPDGQMYATFAGKSAIVLSSSPGAMGGMRSLNPARTLLTNLGVNVLAPSVAVGGAFKAFDASGDLVDERQQKMLHGAMESLVHTARDVANREATCELVKQHLTAGEYGSVSVAGSDV
mmetsp:Transcript_32867/g.72126  ORF Transcript_32867/g.72126 Transcript_32867/m.72126 type:complete len:225 (-) Transcript_32867:158-832(-)